MKLKDNATLSIAAAVSDVLEGKVKEEGKYPHDMFHPETGEKEVAKDEAEHKALSDKGYTHEKPEVDEVAEPKAKGEKDFKAKHTVKKSGAKEDGSVVKENKDLEEKVDPKELASDIPEMELSKFLKKATKAKAAYFDGANLVASKKTKWADKTTLAGALDPKKKYTVQDLIKAIETMKEEVDLGEERVAELTEKNYSPSDEKNIQKTISIMKKYPANKKKSDKELRDGAIEYLFKEEVDLDEGADEIHDRYKRSHGKKASGKSMNWMFTTKRSGDPDDTYHHKGNDTVQAAAAAARKHFGTKDVYVMEGKSIEEDIVDKKLLKKAVDIALKMGGNMTGAVKKIEKLKKGLSKDKEVAAALQLANEEVTEQVVEEAYGMNKKKTKMQEDKERYQKFFKAALKKFGVTSPGELEGEKKKEFFDYVDKNYEADNESD